MIRKQLLLLLLTFLSSSVLADFSIEGQLHGFGSQMPYQDQEKVTASSLGLDAKLDAQYRWKSNFRAQTVPWARYDSLTLSEDKSFLFDWDELSLEWRGSGTQIKMGFSKVGWEGTDFVNPMDLMHMKDWSDPLEARVRSAPGLFYSDSKGSWQWDLNYIFKQQVAWLPGEQSPWWPRHLYLPLQSNEILVFLPDKIEYKISDSQILNNALDHNFGARLQYHGTSFDASLAVFEGAASPPLLTPVINVEPIEVSPREIYQLQSPVHIEPVYYRQQAVAAAVTWTLKSWIFRGSAHYLQPLGKSPRLPEWSQLAVLGAEKTFYFRNQMLTLLAQAITSRRPKSASLSMLSSLYEESYMLGFRWSFSEKWTWLSAFFQEQQSHSQFLHSELTWNFKDQWSQKLSADVFTGSPQSVLGVYDKNDRILLRTSYSF